MSAENSENLLITYIKPSAEDFHKIEGLIKYPLPNIGEISDERNTKEL